jgi:hypothetical protein
VIGIATKPVAAAAATPTVVAYVFPPWESSVCDAEPPSALKSAVTAIKLLGGFCPGRTLTVRTVCPPRHTADGAKVPDPWGGTETTAVPDPHEIEPVVASGNRRLERSSIRLRSEHAKTDCVCGRAALARHTL